MRNTAQGGELGSADCFDGCCKILDRYCTQIGARFPDIQVEKDVAELGGKRWKHSGGEVSKDDDDVGKQWALRSALLPFRPGKRPDRSRSIVNEIPAKLNKMINGCVVVFEQAWVLN